MRRRLSPPTLADSLGLTVVYFLTGALTLYILAETQMTAAEIWIPAGIALAAVLVRGVRMLPPLFAGAFLTGVEYFGASSVMTFAMSSMTGIQACLSAWLGAMLVTKWTGRHNPLLDNRSIILFFLLGGPVSQFPSALMMTGAGWLLNFMPAAEIVGHFLRSWLGGSIGVVLFAPVTMTFLAQPRPNWKPRIVTVAVPLVLISALSFEFIHAAKTTIRQNQQQLLSRTVARVHQRIIDSITEFANLSENLKRLVQVLPRLSASAFKTFSEVGLNERTGIQAIAWIPAQQLSATDRGISIQYIEPRLFSSLRDLDFGENNRWRESLEQSGKSGESLFLDPDNYTLQCGIESLTALIRPVGIPPGKGTDNEASISRTSGFLVYFFDEQAILRQAVAYAREQHLSLSISRDGGNTPPVGDSPGDTGIKQRISVLNQDWLFQYQAGDELAQPWSDLFFKWPLGILYALICLAGFLLLSTSGQRACREKWRNEESARQRQENRLLKSILNHIRHGILACDSSGQVTLVNEAARNQLGIEPGRLAPEKWVEYYQLYEADAKTPLAPDKLPLQQALQGKVVSAYKIVMKKGSAASVLSADSQPVINELGHVRGAVAVFEDVTQDFNQVQELKKLTLAVQHCPIGIMVTDAEGRIEYVNRKFEQMNGYSLTEVIGQTPMILKSSDIPENVLQNKWISLLNGRDWQGEVLNRKKNGEYYWAKLLISPFRNSRGKLLHYVSIVEDVTELRKKSEIISYQASHDDLTGLLNRRECEKRLERIIANTRQQDAHHVFCFLDLDNFKQINDTCGHVAGDEVLRLVSELLIKQLRQRDTLARLGGDEFGIIMEHCFVQQAREIAEQICAAIKEYDFYWQEQCFKLGVSIGLTEINEYSASFTAVMQEADIACYRAKKQGRGQVELYAKSNGNTDTE